VVRQRRSVSRRRSAARFEIDLRDPNFAALWARLALTATQLSQLTGVSRRQVEWWRQRGYLTPSPDQPDRFSGDAVTLALLIKQGLDAGVPLQGAYLLATRHLAARLSEGLAASTPDTQANQQALTDLEQKLLATQNTIGLVLDVIAPLVQRAERESGEDGGAEPEAAPAG
jgi:DNA-binding transcriptional MerR regulator